MTVPADPTWTTRAGDALAGALAGDMTSQHFRTVADLLYETAGIRLVAGKEGLVRSRLASRFRALGIATFDEYLARVSRGAADPEFQHFIDVLTTNKTSFFREAEHFAFMERVVIPALEKKRPARFWSAGCSTGEEAYTLAMVLRDAGMGDVTRILATDISTRVIAKAEAGVYPASSVDGIPAAFRPHFESRRGEENVRVVEATRRLVTFAYLNLMGAWPMRGSFQAIFCRNVMIYFDRPTQERLVQRFQSLLAPGGYLFVGHSESLTTLAHGLTYVQPAVYRNDP